MYCFFRRNILSFNNFFVIFSFIIFGDENMYFEIKVEISDEKAGGVDEFNLGRSNEFDRGRSGEFDYSGLFIIILVFI